MASFLQRMMGETTKTQRHKDFNFFFVSLCLCGSLLLFLSQSAKAQNNDQSELPPVREVITVTPGRVEMPLAETASSVDIIESLQIDLAPSRTLDDLLRQIPGFSLLRRTSSLVAHPTTQGVSLRGLGTNGASRTLVLLDNIPLNDPFGGWVYWRRVPKPEIERVEVVQGSRSDLYGSSAMSGVIQVITRRPEARILNVDTDLGNLGTRTLSLFGSHKIGGAGLSVAGELFTTDGYNLLSVRERGPVDEPARSQHGALDLRFTYDFSSNLQTSLRASSFSEDRANGTLLQRNHTEIRSYSASLRWKSPDGSNWYGNAFGGIQTFNSTFSAISLDRQRESLTRDQRVPAHTVGFSGQWSRAIGERHTLLAGLDWRDVVGINNEKIFLNNLQTGLSVNGGSQNSLGIFLQDSIAALPNFRLIFGAQVNRVHNEEQKGKNSRTETVLNPKIGFLYHPRDWVGIRASGYRAFRSPTLNELYRPFRLGNVLTLANSALRSEILTGGEAGIDFTPTLAVRISMTAFGAELSGPVANVTLQSRPDLVTRQRQNLGAIRSEGIEINAEYTLKERFLLNAGYLYTRSRVTSFSANPALVGTSVPQSPRHLATLSATYLSKLIGSFTLQYRSSSSQFEDDQNRLRLAGYGLVDIGYRRSIGKRLAAFVNVENLFDRRISTGRTLVETLGAPRLFSIGVRVKIGRI
jgi:iron complex outermembrane recepter protein